MVVERQLQVTFIMVTAPNHAHTATCAGVNFHTASRQLSEVKHVPAQLVKCTTVARPCGLATLPCESNKIAQFR